MERKFKKLDSLNHWKHCLAAFHMLWCECAGHRLREMQCLPLCLSLWAEPLQTMNFIVYISSCSRVCPWKLCCHWQFACRALDPHTVGLPCTCLQYPNPQVWALQLFSTLRHLQKLIHEIHEDYNPNPVLLDKNSNVWCIFWDCTIKQLKFKHDKQKNIYHKCSSRYNQREVKYVRPNPIFRQYMYKVVDSFKLKG